jgi:hypothetical protein
MTPSTSTDGTYLVIADITYIADGALLEKDTQLFWVFATNKRNAAVSTVRYIRRTTTRTLASVKVRHVVATTQWGDSYFTQIREHDEAQHQQPKT